LEYAESNLLNSPLLWNIGPVESYISELI